MNKFGGASAKLKLALLCIRLAQIFGEPHLHQRRRLQHGDRTAPGGLSQNITTVGMITRKDVGTGDIIFDAVFGQ